MIFIDVMRHFVHATYRKRHICTQAWAEVPLSSPVPLAAGDDKDKREEQCKASEESNYATMSQIVRIKRIGISSKITERSRNQTGRLNGKEIGNEMLM